MILWTYTTGMAGNVASRDPLAALDYIMGAPDQSVFVLKDFHPFISDVAVTRRLRDLVYALKTSYKTLILLSPLLKLPPELEKEITVVDYQLPNAWRKLTGYWKTSYSPSKTGRKSKPT